MVYIKYNLNVVHVLMKKLVRKKQIKIKYKKYISHKQKTYGKQQFYTVMKLFVEHHFHPTLSLVSMQNDGRFNDR